MIDVAFRANDDARITEADVVRVLDASSEVVVIANAYDTGFSTHWSAGSRVVLDLFTERWNETHDLEASFGHVRLEFPPRARALVGDDADDVLVGEPGATLLVARIGPSYVDVAWIGPEHLVVVRDGAVTHRTQPDTLLEKFRAEGFDMGDSPHRHIITRTIRREDILPPHTARFALEKGDRVIAAHVAVDDALALTAKQVLEKLPRDRFECAVVVVVT